MSLGEANAKFPGQQGDAEGPSPTRENPAGVFPKSSPIPAPTQDTPGSSAPLNPGNAFSNPYALDDALVKLKNALAEVISAIGTEEHSEVSGEAGLLLARFKVWSNELDAIRSGNMESLKRLRTKETSDARVGGTQEGGMFDD